MPGSCCWRRSRGSFALLCLGVLVFRAAPGRADCRAAGLCCSGRDPSCTSEGWRADRSYGPCYCDQACVSTRDCCHDYEAACPAVSCVVSEWTQWSGCAEPCRATVRRRSRVIVQEPLNAGKPCPHLEEHAGCAEYWSNQGNCHSSLVPALITTGGYGNTRKKRDLLLDSGDIIGYCVQFQLTSLTKGCQESLGPHTRWMQYLQQGHHVCVKCQPPALANGQQHCAGDGEESLDDRRQSLQWQAVGNPRCKGVWRRVGRLEACSCPTAHSFLFI
ncbi:somatomedin-B and thrombospondin type-1 domain-containing protein [Pleuronectes platessa]|uniref:somatomedin-B and thrombospondin type-1 domain-containing protein n=1 Tax=Pleuronectes platessa TaxID=8262 RepID=UPI00232A09C3|nr:somatomedin-B and thrombospondin type-1 domain-containing protein [Pleuronectes platessa]